MTAAADNHGTSETGPLGAVEWVFLGFLLVIWPGISWLWFPSGEAALVALSARSRISVYLQSIAITASVFLLLAIILQFRRHKFTALGYCRFTVVNAAFGFLLAAVVAVVLWVSAAIMPSLRPGPGDFARLLFPRTFAERLLWLGLSLTAAIGEETLFRGFLLTRCRQVCGHWVPAVVVSSCGFGLAHLYQGVAGVLLTGLCGILFSLMFIKRRSLWPCFVGHFLQDASAFFMPIFPFGT